MDKKTFISELRQALSVLQEDELEAMLSEYRLLLQDEKNREPLKTLKVYPVQYITKWYLYLGFATI